MPTYTYRCLECEKRQDAYRTVAERNDCPKCDRCYGVTEKILTPTMVAVFHPYTPVAADKDDGKRRVIRTKKEHEAFLRRNGYEEVGNDKSMAPPSAEKLAEKAKAWRDAPDAPMVNPEKLKREGWLQEDITV
jgi:putative FmdB family regulatory protein